MKRARSTLLEFNPELNKLSKDKSITRRVIRRCTDRQYTLGCQR